MRYGNTQIPEWLELEIRSRNPEPNFNDIIEVLLKDYIKRNKPPWIDLTPLEYVQRYAAKIHEGGKIVFHNHDLNEWQEPTYEILTAYEEMRADFNLKNKRP